jgi:hypothetical protein
VTSLPAFNQWTPVEGCSSGGAGGSFMLPISEAIVVNSVNVFAPLSQTPATNASAVTLSVNGRNFFNVGPTPDFSISGTAITWLSSIYSVAPDDDVIASYFYIGAG